MNIRKHAESLTYADSVRFALQALRRFGFRTGMMLLAMSLAVGSVVTFTALGEGARGYVMEQFSALGKDLLVVLPGRKETKGDMPPMMGPAARTMSLHDAHVISRVVRGVKSVAPLAVGTGAISANSRSRETMVLGTTLEYLHMRQLEIGQGQNLPDVDPTTPVAVCVIGEKIRTELFGTRQAVGQWIKIGDRRFRVEGVLKGKGDSSGMNLGDAVIIPVASALSIFNTEGLFRILVELRENYSTAEVKQDMLVVFKQLHQGEEDVTIISPDAMVSTFDKLFDVLTAGVGGIAGISLLVAGVLVMNLTWISVSQRTKEIGLLKALGASAAHIRRIFLLESILLCGVGAVLGILAGEGMVLVGRELWPTVPFVAPLWAVISSGLIAIVTGLLFAWLPSKRAAMLQPVEALTGK